MAAPRVPTSDPYWSRTSSELLADFRSSPTGLTTAEANARLNSYGANLLGERSRAGLPRLFLRQFSNPLVLILALAALVAALLHEPADSAIILVVVFGSAILTAAQEYRATAAVERLRERIALRSTVYRDGTEMEVPATNVVPGDVVAVIAGTLIPADGVLVEARDLFVDQAALTGESVAVEKLPGPVGPEASLTGRTNVLFMGTSVRSGSGRMLVMSTGMSTVYGEVARRLARRPPETDFERGIRRFGYLLTRIILLLVLVVFAANVFLERPPVDSLLFAIALAVGISPELLPAIISVTLAKGAREMGRDGVIVRRLNAIENFGSMDVLCSDKTGTLTEGRMRLQAAVDGAGNESATVLRAATINARLQASMHNPLDEAIAMASPNSDPLPRKLDEIPYDFVRRRVTVVVEEGSGASLITKGALAQLLDVCTLVREGGAAIPLTQKVAEDLEDRLAGWSSEGFRVLGVATKAASRQERYRTDQEAELTFEGFLLFADPPKAGVDGVIRAMRDLGVQLKIITGDNRYVARYVADRVGIEDVEVITGKDLDLMSDESLRRRAAELTVFAEVDPNQKERIIIALQKTGHVVGFLGDGINDAPALHVADVGISVDGAADVARETADLVLLEHDLSVLRQGIVRGRTTFANTLKYIHVTTSANFGNMVSMALASVFLPFLPLLASQILLNNFLSDLPALAIAGDRVDQAMVDVPRRWDVTSIQRFMIVFGLVSTAFDFLTFGLLLYVFEAGAELFRTGWFVLSLLTELVVIFIIRTRLPLLRSEPSVGLVGTAAATGLLALALPFSPLGRVFEFAPLPPALLGGLVLLTVGYGVATGAAKRWLSGPGHAPIGHSGGNQNLTARPLGAGLRGG